MAAPEIEALNLVIDTIKELQQPGILEKEIDNWYNGIGIPATEDALRETAYHFYELGLKAGKEKNK